MAGSKNTFAGYFALGACFAMLVPTHAAAVKQGTSHTPLEHWFSDIKIIATPDRRVHMQSVMANLGVSRYAFADTVTRDSVAQQPNINWKVAHPKNLNEIALFAAHVKILERVANSNDDQARVLVFEDDIAITQDPQSVQQRVQEVMTSLVTTGANATSPRSSVDWEYLTFGKHFFSSFFYGRHSLHQSANAFVAVARRLLRIHAPARTRTRAQRWSHVALAMPPAPRVPNVAARIYMVHLRHTHVVWCARSCT